MRIVSQYKSISVDFEHISLWTERNMIYAKYGTENMILGCYSQEERAGEVFDEIHEHYCNRSKIVYYMPEE